MATVMPSESNFWLVVAPSQNFEGTPTIEIGGHEVPLLSYWMISTLVEHGRPEDDIVRNVMRHTGTRALNVVTEIVSSITENQRLLSGPTATPRSSNRFSVAFMKPKKLSDYRASRIEARRELALVEEKLETAKQTEKKVLNEVMILSQRKEDLNGMRMTPDQRRKTLAEVEEQMKQVLQKHHNVETQIAHAKRLTAIHKASLA